VGIATLMLLATPARWVPGRAATTAVVIGALIIASLVWLARSRQHLPPLVELASATPVLVLALVPFAAVGRAGTLGVGVDNDMSEHLPYVEALMSKAVERVTPLQAAYPLGPHSVVAAISIGLHIRADLAFAGFTVALVLVGGWTALHALRNPTTLGPVLMTTAVGLPYLVAAYYGEGSFKEVLMAQLVLGLALWLDAPVPSAGRWMFVPLALLVTGTTSVYSGPGLLWPAAFVGIWLVGQIAGRVARSGMRPLVTHLRRKVALFALAVAGLAVFLIPEIPQLKNSFGLYHDRAALGNLVGPLSFEEALGVWPSPDFRYGISPGLASWSGFIGALSILGVIWSIRRRRWMLPASAGAAVLIWVYSTHVESPYVSAKALVVLSPLLLLLAALPLAERGTHRSAVLWAVSSTLAIGLWVHVADSDLRALRASSVGPIAHVDELRQLRPVLKGEPTLFLGNDDFIKWELAGVRVTRPVYIDMHLLRSPPEKPWWVGQSLDIDSVRAQTINANDWVITTRDSAQSQMPPQLHLVRTTPDFELWHRTGTVTPRRILNEGQDPGAILDCTTAVRDRIRGGGVAAVRGEPVSIPVGAINPGGTSVVPLALKPGAWDIETRYESPVPLTVTGPQGVLRLLPANLDRPGPRWPIGRVVVPSSGSVAVTLHAWDSWLTPSTDLARNLELVATPVGTEHLVPLKAACGAYVDWYRNPLQITAHPGQVTEISDFPNDLLNPGLQATGIYSDGWVARNAGLVLAGGPATDLVLRGRAVYTPGWRTRLFLRVNGRRVAVETLSPGGPVSVKVPIPASRGDRHIQLHFTKTAPIARNDPRVAAIDLSYLGFQG
jgi:hypothetical protein